MSREKILFIGGSLNMTRMVHEVSRHLMDEFDCYFTPFYTDGIYDLLARHTRLLNWNIVGTTGPFRRDTDTYLEEHNLPVDWRGEGHDYALYVTTSDLYVPKNIRNKRVILIQEGMTDPEGFGFWLVKNLKFPRYFGSTSTNGMSNQYLHFCVASDGYRDFFIRKGVRPEKLVVTGIPNFDNCAAYLDNDFPDRHFVLVATSDARETKKVDNRKKFIREALDIADGRPIIFKLHPNEIVERATREILELAPHAQIFARGKIEHMIANCDVLVCQYSTVVYTGLALGKECYSYFDMDELHRLMPIQNGGTSGRNIAQVCRHVLYGEPVTSEEFAVENGGVAVGSLERSYA